MKVCRWVETGFHSYLKACRWVETGFHSYLKACRWVERSFPEERKGSCRGALFFPYFFSSVTFSRLMDMEKN